MKFHSNLLIIQTVFVCSFKCNSRNVLFPFNLLYTFAVFVTYFKVHGVNCLVSLA